MESDLFSSYNEEFAKRVRPRVVLGPPASGKCFIITNYFSREAYESIIGFPNLKPAEPCAEHEAGVGLKKSQASRFAARIAARISSWAKDLADTMSADKALRELEEGGFSKDEINQINEYFKNVKRLPRRVVEHLMDVRRYGPVAVYRIPWDVERNSLRQYVAEAVEIIKRHFEKGIRWLGADYIPPGLAAEVVNKLREGRDKAEEYVKEQAEAYYSIVKLLVGEGDVEFEGFLAEWLKEFTKRLIPDSVKNVLGFVIEVSRIASIPLSAALATTILFLIFGFSRQPRGEVVKVFIELREYWRRLCPTLKRLVASKAALQLGITPREAEKALDQLTGLDVKQLEQVVGQILVKLKEIELQQSGAKAGVNIYTLGDVENGLLYPNIRLIGKNLVVVSETYGGLEVNVVKTGKFNDYLKQLLDRVGRGPVVLAGPKGTGKSTLAVYAVWELLRRGGFYGVVKIEELTDANARLRLENFLRIYDEVFAGTFGKLIVLYDPSPATAYTAYGVKDVVEPAVLDTVGQLAEPMGKKAELPLVVVIPSDWYNALNDKVKSLLDKYKIYIDLRDEEYIKGLLREYSGCPLDDETAKGLAAKILQFDEGYALIARLAGEEVRHGGCEVGDVEALLGDTQGNALAFIVHYANRLLGVKVREDGVEKVRPDRVEKLSRLLAVRRPLAATAEPGGYVMPSGLVERWFGWEGLSYSEGDARWLAARHHQLVEEALARIADAATGEIGKIPEPLEKALDPWIQHSDKGLKEGVKPREAPEAVKYFAEKYGEKLLEELKSQCAEPKCWRRIALMAGVALTGHPFKALAEAIEEVRKYEDMFQGLVEAAGQSGLDRLFLEGGELTPFSRALLIASAQPGFPNSVYAAAADKHREVAKEIEALWQRWKQRRDISHYEAVYAIGLVALLANALELGAKVGMKTVKNALRVATFGVDAALLYHKRVDDVIKALSPLCKRAPEDCTPLLYTLSEIEAMAPINPLSALEMSLIIHVKEDPIILAKLNEVARHVKSSWAKAYLAVAYAHFDVKKSCSHLRGIKDKILRTVAEAFTYSRFVIHDKKCITVDICKKLEEVAEKLYEMVKNKFDEIKSDEQLMEYLRRWSLTPEEALGRLLKEAVLQASRGAAKCISHKGDYDKAEEL